MSPALRPAVGPVSPRPRPALRRGPSVLVAVWLSDLLSGFCGRAAERGAGVTPGAGGSELVGGAEQLEAGVELELPRRQVGEVGILRWGGRGVGEGVVRDPPQGKQGEGEEQEAQLADRRADPTG